MLLTQKLLRRHLKIKWEYALAIGDSLWLIGVTEDKATPAQSVRNRFDYSFLPELAEAIITIADRIRKQADHDRVD